jgi:hypothetical protein
MGFNQDLVSMNRPEQLVPSPEPNQVGENFLSYRTKPKEARLAMEPATGPKLGTRPTYVAGLLLLDDG